jgi:hypothetical protein
MTACGRELLRLRTERKLTLGEVARRVPCSTSYLSNVSYGRADLTPRIAGQLDKILEVGAFAAYAAQRAGHGGPSSRPPPSLPGTACHCRQRQTVGTSGKSACVTGGEHLFGSCGIPSQELVRGCTREREQQARLLRIRRLAQAAFRRIPTSHRGRCPPQDERRTGVRQDWHRATSVHRWGIHKPFI